MKKLFIPAICLLVIIGSCSKKSSPTGEKAVDAASVFSSNCARCHGADGATGRAPNLTKIDLTPGEIMDIVTHGKGHMPALGDKLSAREISAVAQFVAKLKK